MIVLDENRIGRAEHDRSVPARGRAVDRHAISQIAGPVVDELIVVDDSHWFAGRRAGVALKLDPGAQELREADVEDLEILRRALDVETPIGDGGDGRRSIAFLQGVEPALQCHVGEFEGQSRLGIDDDHGNAGVVALDQESAVPPRTSYVDAVRGVDDPREAVSSGGNGDRVPGAGTIDRCLEIGRVTAPRMNHGCAGGHRVEGGAEQQA